MAKFTAELRELVWTFGEDEVTSWFTDYDLNDYLSDEEIAIIEERGTWSKEKLAKRIIEHYFTREIALETPGEFKLHAKVAMQEIMEEKLPLIYSMSIKYNPLVNVDYTETYTGENTGNSTSNSTGLVVNSDTPQGQINKTDILEGTYASNTSGNQVDDSTNTNGNQSYTKNVKGNSGVSATAQKMIQQYRQNIVMINRDIIKDLSSLFIGLY